MAGKLAGACFLSLLILLSNIVQGSQILLTDPLGNGKVLRKL
jgi:hypothetical protein